MEPIKLHPDTPLRLLALFALPTENSDPYGNCGNCGLCGIWVSVAHYVDKGLKHRCGRGNLLPNYQLICDRCMNEYKRWITWDLKGERYWAIST